MKIYSDYFFRRAIFCLFLALLTVPVYATTYYVDYANGSDSNNGTSKTTAFRHAPGDPSATGTAGGINLGAGDVIQFRAGIEYKGQIQTSWSGSSNNYIEYRGQGWGTGRATFNMEDTRGYAFKGGADYIKITGFNLYHYSSSGSDYVIYPSSGASYWDIDSCSIAYIKDWENVSVFPDKPCVYLTNSTSHITINHTEFFASGRTVIRLRYTSYVTIKNCNFGGINRGSESGWFSVGIRGEVTCNNIHIEDNVFHDGWQYGGDQVPELNHAPAFIHIYGSDATTHPDQIYIERNYFYNDKTFSTGTGTGSVEITTQVHNIYIRNNILANACQYWGTQLMLADGCDNVYVENNTFIDRAYVTGYGVNSLKVYLNSIPVGNNVYIRNNIFWSDANSSGDCAVYFHGSGTFQGVINNNEYYRNSSNQVNTFNGSVVSWSAWQGHGLDAASQYHNITEPAFVYMPPSGATTSSGDYSLNPAAINLINKGVTLNGFNDSYNGVSRPQGAAWDIGAYEYNGQNSDITPPEVTGASINNQTTVVVSFSEDVQAAGAQNPSNYSISGGVTVSSAVLNGTQVTLTTSTHSFNQQYTVTVSNVKDLAGNLINPNADSAQYLLEGDTNPPEVTSAELSDSITVLVHFSEAVSQTAAENASNYSIDNGIDVSSASLSSNGMNVTLTTGIHIIGPSYTVSVENIQDLAGNTISVSANSAQYQLIIIPAGDLNQLNIVEAVSSNWYQNYMPPLSIDGISDPSSESRWAGAVVMPDTITFDLGELKLLKQSKFSFYRWDQGRIYHYSVLVSSDNINWFQVVTAAPSDDLQWSVMSFYPIVGQYVKLISLDNNESQYAGVWEAEILGSEAPVPVELTSFTVNQSSNSVEIKWSTGTETNNKGFEVQKKVNGNYSVIGFVEGHGTTTEPYDYKFNDNEIQPGDLTYRIRQVDLDGSFEYSDEVTVSIDKPSDFELSQNYPNPFNPTTKIRFSIPSDNHVKLTLYNLLGERVRDIIDNDYKAGTHEINLDASGLSSGVYLYKLESGNYVNIKKMMVMK